MQTKKLVLAVVTVVGMLAPVAFGQEAPAAKSRKLADAACGAGAPVDLNTASADDIAKAIPGVGPAKAAALIAARPFKTWADVDAVKGVGPAVFAATQRCAKDPAAK